MKSPTTQAPTFSMKGSKLTLKKDAKENPGTLSYVPSIRERQIEEYFVTRCADAGLSQRKLQFINYNGAPDRLVMATGGRAAFAELKASKDGKVSSNQEREHKRLRDLGFHVFILNTYEAIDRFVESWP